jgi:hypothetical protein
VAFFSFFVSLRDEFCFPFFFFSLFPFHQLLHKLREKLTFLSFLPQTPKKRDENLFCGDPVFFLLPFGKLQAPHRAFG